MRLPTQLSRNNSNVHKNDFGHALIVAGSRRMLGASALCGLAAMRTGSGLVTLGIPKSLNTAAQKKINAVLMTLPLAETKSQSISLSAFRDIQKLYKQYQAIAIGPGLSTDSSTQKLVLKIIQTSPHPLVIDADALNALANHGKLDILKATSTPKILTPHPGEMARLIKKTKVTVENNRGKIALDFAHQYNCTLLLKGHDTIIASAERKRVTTNTTGNAGMATAGSGDVLTGIIVSFLAQGLSAFEAATYGAYLHGRAGDLAATSKTKLAMIATDIIDFIPQALRRR